MDLTINSVEYGTVDDEHRAAALALLVSRQPAGERASGIATILAALRQGDAATAMLVGSRRAGQLTTVAWAQMLPGKTALLWPPCLAAGELEAVGDQLQRYLDQRLEAAGVRLAQAILPHRDHADAHRLRRTGYLHAADILYLRSHLGGRETAARAFDVDFVPYTPANRRRLAELVERTYIDTLDVPALDGIRDLDDVLHGYEQTGQHAPDRWFFIRHKDEDVGCLLLTDHPEQQQWELVYMGIVPAARGNGWGLQATRFAQHCARAAGRERLVLAVDAKNDPAVDAYTRAGFFELLRRSVFLKTFEA